MRLFAAVVPPPEAVGHLEEFLDGLRTARPDLRWVPPARWHLTLQFLGECGPYEVERQRDRWERRALRSRPMQVRLAGAGAFPHPWMARAVWVGLAGAVDAFSALAADDQVPHLTVARTRERAELSALVDEVAHYDGPTWTAHELVLVESRLGAETGPRYRPLETVPLGEESDRYGSWALPG
ncbi:RNA 2',3'-cyclic phosphodiesterase [Nakamurella deserti]|uniref:RNA 2',3'-cyclic phosphodiesterase n=1 Tax=Nakamurella deserti TaxID=2164074 RepID=UPI000DBE1ECA|nr:RNA 2',3'-cyclic phosphodiesterase [Nakamurella deserti]